MSGANASSGVPIADDVLPTFQKLKASKEHKYCIFQIVDNTIKVTQTGDKNSTHDQLISQLTESDPAYILYDCHVELKDGQGVREKIIFVSWCPENCPVKKKMIHSSSLQNLAQVLQQRDIMQAHEFEEITLFEIGKKLCALTSGLDISKVESVDGVSVEQLKLKS